MKKGKNSEIIGLSSAQAHELFEKWGPNVIKHKENSIIYKLIKKLLTPVSVMLFAAAFLSFLTKDIFNFYFILLLIGINYFVSFWQEHKADNALDKLNEKLEVEASALRDGQWMLIDSSKLVPGDLIRITIGDVMPADVKIKDASNFLVNESSLTGESLPQEKKKNDFVYSGAYVETGEALAFVEKTGDNTYFGQALVATEKPKKRSILETDVLSISKFLSIISLLGVVIITLHFMGKGFSALKIITTDLSLIIAGIPVALPTVMTLIISIGVVRLSKKGAIVRKLASLENLANVDVLFTDKTGTLTQNNISIDKIISYSLSNADVLRFAYIASFGSERNIINKTIINKARQENIENDFEIKEFILGDSERKRSSALAQRAGKIIYVTVGAPQVVKSLCKIDEKTSKKFENDIKTAAKKGYRSLAVAVNLKDGSEDNLRLAGLLLLSDPLHDDAKKTILFLKKNGIKINMLTGDHVAIGQRIGHELGLSKNNIYCEVLPKDKYNLVVSAEKEHVVAVTGDGINDLPAIRSADVGIAVSNAVDALKSSADIVLLSPGISTINDAIIESRKIFARLHIYAVYRISESFRIIITVVFLSLGYHFYILAPVQLIILALLNDIPIVSLAFDRVKIFNKPARLETKKRMVISILFGVVGLINSLLFVYILRTYFSFDWSIISTAFFLKLTVSGHMLIFVAHTDGRWYKFLPSKQVIWAVITTQLIATAITFFGIAMSEIPVSLIIFVWLWASLWMQISDYTKSIQRVIFRISNYI